MPPRQNPLRLNPLQLRTLAVLQALAGQPGAADNGPWAGEKTIETFPQAHSDHYHLGATIVAARDASGLYNEKVWHALERKGLVRADWPHRITLTPLGQTYDTRAAREIFRPTPHQIASRS